MTLTVWTNHSQQNIIRVTFGEPSWVYIYKAVGKHPILTNVTEQEAQRIITDHKLIQQNVSAIP